MAPLQDGRSADSTSDPKKTGGEGNKTIKLLKMLESKKQKNAVGRPVAKKKMSWMVACWRKVAKTKSGIGC